MSRTLAFERGASAGASGPSEAEVQAMIDASIDDLVDASPTTLDTLNELAAALGDDANFAATITAALAAKAPLDLTINAQTGTTYTPVLSDDGKLVTLSNAAAIAVTLPQDSDVALPVGAQIHFLQLGAGQPTFAAGTGATANGTPGLKIRAQYAIVSAVKRAANVWVLVGDLAA